MATIDLGKIKFVFRDTYDNSASYVPDDVVTFTDGSVTSSYICKTATSGNNPSSGGTVHANWQFLAKGQATSPTTTQGDIIVRGASADGRLAIGSAGQALKVNSSANGLEYGAAGLFVSYAIIADRKSANADGGSITANTWTVRDLNTEIADPDGIVSISANRFTLGAGTYLIKWRCPGLRCQKFNSALYNYTDSAYAGFGESAYSYSSDGDTSYAVGMARVTIGASKVFDIRMICNATANTTGMGRGADSMSNFNSAGGQETYTTVEIYKEP